MPTLPRTSPKRRCCDCGRCVTIPGSTIPLDERQATPLSSQTSPSPLEIIVQREDEQWLQERIRNLPPTQHAVLHMRQVECRPNAQIAALLGMKESSVSTLLARARRQLLEEIRQHKNERQ